MSLSSKHDSYIPSLDGLRAVAVLIVVFSHVGLKGVMPGGFGVTIFFFLSGYLITTLLRRELLRTGSISLKLFYLRRVLRIFPPMYIALALAALLAAWASVSLSGSTLLMQSIHLTNYHVALGGTGEPPGSEVLWSLAVEEHFYLVFPLAFIVLSTHVREQARPYWLCVACACVLAWRIVLMSVLGGHAEYIMHATDTRIDSILFGCALALWRNPTLPDPKFSPRAIWIMVALAVPVLAATLIARDELFRETARYTLQGVALAPIFIAAISFPAAWPFRILNLRPVRWIGLLSYSLYLVHLPIIRFLETKFHLANVQLLVISLVASLAVSATIYLTVEVRCAELRRRLAHQSAR